MKHDNTSSTPRPGTLRLHRFTRAQNGRPALHVVGPALPGPRFARLRSLGSTALDLQTASGGDLPATGVRWELAGKGVALSLILPN